jgi:hypothetical protein
MTALRPPGAAVRQAWLVRATMVVILACAVVPRVPLLVNARASFNSDEAVDALVLQHLLHQGEITLFNWDARYYGIVENLLSLPFLAAGLDIPLAARLGSLVGFLALQVAVFLLGRRLHGTAAGLLGAALLAAFSPQLVMWSAFASGGYALVVAWGTFTLLQYDSVRRRPSGGNLAALGFMIGFGLYIYELYLVYLAALAAAFVLASGPARRLWRRLSRGLSGGLRTGASAAALRAGSLDATPRTGSLAATPETLRGPAPILSRGTILRGVLFVLGFALGWAPKIALLVSRAPLGAKRPAYSLASLPVMASNLKLLLAQCGPSLLGANPTGNPHVAPLVGGSWPLSRPLGILLLAFYAAAWSAAAWRLLRGSAGTPSPGPASASPGTAPGPIGTAVPWAPEAVARGPAGTPAASEPSEPGRLPSAEAVLVLLVPVTAALFVASPNVVGRESNHYLLPILASLALVGADLLVRLGRRAPAAAWALGALLVAVPLVEIASWYRAPGQFHYLGAGLRLLRGPIATDRLLRFLDRQGIHHAYSDYWVAYRATLLSDERVVVAPRDWDRYPRYTREVDAAPREAYIFTTGDPGEEGFLARLRASGRRATLTTIPAYRIYTSAAGGRLLPPSLEAVEPLIQPRAEITAHPPNVWPAGAVAGVLVTVRNRGAAAWSAAGKESAGGAFRVAVSYHWLDAAGRPAVFEGRRTMLPHDLAPGTAAALVAQVEAPAAPGRYSLCLTLVQEGVAWFDQLGAGAAAFPVEVTAIGSPSPPAGRAAR